MKPLHLFLLLALILTLSLSNTSCTKEDPPSACCDCLKEATQSGKGTMSMKINGKPWSNCNQPNPEYSTVGVAKEQTKFAINGRRLYDNVESKEDMYILVPYLQLREYQGFKGKYFFRLFFTNSPTYGSSEFATDTSKPSHLFITKFDENNRIVSGVFDCWMIENDGGIDTATLHFTEGRFDTKF